MTIDKPVLHNVTECIVNVENLEINVIFFCFCSKAQRVIIAAFEKLFKRRPVGIFLGTASENVDVYSIIFVLEDGKPDVRVIE